MAKVYALARLSREMEIMMTDLEKDGSSTCCYLQKYQQQLCKPLGEMSCIYQAEWKLQKLFPLLLILANIAIHIQLDKGAQYCGLLGFYHKQRNIAFKLFFKECWNFSNVTCLLQRTHHIQTGRLLIRCQIKQQRDK